MRATRKILSVAAGAALLLCGSAALATNGSKVFSGYVFPPITGKVGYHLVAHGGFERDPCKIPPEHIHASELTIEGTVPPGISPPGSAPGQFGFEGTPRQPGDWQVTVIAHNLSCSTNGSSGPVNYGDLKAIVNIHIDP